MKYLSLSFLGALLGLCLSVQSAFAITVSPVKIEVSGDPGHAVTGELELFNGEKNAVTLYSSFEKFEAQGETGNPVFTPGTEDLSTWIQVTPSITLQPMDRVKLPFRITIPADATPGGHFAAIFWNNAPPTDLQNSEVRVGSKIGILVLLKVSGEVTESGNFIGFGTENDQTFFTSPPVNFWYRFQNAGSDRVKPTGTILIKNTFGLKATEFNANPTDGNVLPQSIRRLTASWLEKDHWDNVVKIPDDKSFLSLASYELQHFHFGRFTAHLNLEYGTEGKIAYAKVSFLMIPWHALIIVIPTLFIIFILGIIFLKRYNRWIIRQANAKTQG